MNAKLVVMMIFLMGVLGAPAAFVTAPRVDFPRAGQALQGVVLVSGSTNINGFQSAEFAFSHAGASARESDWFLIQYSDEPVEDGDLAVWDTTTISDGDYQLRVSVLLADGRTRETVVDNLRVRNYTAIETATPSPAPEGAVEVSPTEVEPVLSVMTPTALPANPVVLTGNDVRRNLITGIIAGASILGFLGFYTLLRKWLRLG